MIFKYLEHHNKLQVECPPKDYKSFKIAAYRWIFDEGNVQNFQTQYEKFMKRYPNPSNPPKRYNDISDIEKQGTKMCEDMAYSMYVSVETAENGFVFFLERYKEKTFEMFGKNIASAEISEQDGVNSKIDNNGHFNHHPATTIDYEEKFQVVACFIK